MAANAALITEASVTLATVMSTGTSCDKLIAQISETAFVIVD
jgi:hypothetical protein